MGNKPSHTSFLRESLVDYKTLENQDPKTVLDLCVSYTKYLQLEKGKECHIMYPQSLLPQPTYNQICNVHRENNTDKLTVRITMYLTYDNYALIPDDYFTKSRMTSQK